MDREIHSRTVFLVHLQVAGKAQQLEDAKNLRQSGMGQQLLFLVILAEVRL